MGSCVVEERRIIFFGNVQVASEVYEMQMHSPSKGFVC